MNLTTDNYIDKFFPFRIMKEVGFYLQKVLSEEQVHIVQKLERDKMKELYRHLTKEENENEVNALFKRNMLELFQRLKEKFPLINPLIKQKEEIDWDDFDAIPSEKEKLIQAINIIIGSETEMNPELIRRIHQLENLIEGCDVTCKEMRLIVKNTLEEDGELNVSEVKKQLLQMKDWVAYRLEQDKSFVQALHSEIDDRDTKNGRQVGELSVQLEYLLKEVSTCMAQNKNTHKIQLNIEKLQYQMSELTAGNDTQISIGVGEVSQLSQISTTGSAPAQAVVRQKSRQLSLLSKVNNFTGNRMIDSMKRSVKPHIHNHLIRRPQTSLSSSIHTDRAVHPLHTLKKTDFLNNSLRMSPEVKERNSDYKY